MIKTLRITSIAAAILAAVFFVFPVVFGLRGDYRIEQFLDSAGVIEKFNRARGDKAKRSGSQVSPLVKQAEAFALYLNPPPPKMTAVPHKRGITRRPPTVSAKFELIGTSFYPSHPELSLALIDEPGKGLRWVRQSSGVGRLVIEQVKDGLVVVRDGKRTFELVAERPEKRSLLKTTGQTDSGEAGAGIKRSRPPRMSPEEQAAWEEIISKLNKLKAMQPDEADLGSANSWEKGGALMEKLASDLEAMRISAEEAKKLDHLGKELKSVGGVADDANVQQDPNWAKDDRTESDANSPEGR